jgi:hypothetical protein
MLAIMSFSEGNFSSPEKKRNLCTIRRAGGDNQAKRMALKNNGDSNQVSVALYNQSSL